MTKPAHMARLSHEFLKKKRKKKDETFHVLVFLLSENFSKRLPSTKVLHTQSLFNLKAFGFSAAPTRPLPFSTDQGNEQMRF